MCPFFFLNFCGKWIISCKNQRIYIQLNSNIYIYIYNEKALRILEIYDLKKMLANTIYNFNIFSKNV